ncbi:von Willebrand factor A domain-containing protein 5A isoform X2 [Maylandia zebra]|uniref:von Willebrand factor A domain-containing protein 5A isoform X2 n=1 Tax=Maylandia zebra TaxID=106582 RepID=UPI00403D2EA7
MPFLIATDYVGCTLNPYQNCEGYMDADQESGDYMDCALPLDQDYETSVSEQQTRDPLLQLVSLQEATGKWLLDPALPTALGKTNEEVEKSKPVLANKEIWATILALIWLHGLKMDSKNEWDLLAMKAASWLRAQNAPWVTECVEAANLLLGCSVMKEALGL